MEMTLRWFGNNFDSVTLEQIRQIPGAVSYTHLRADAVVHHAAGVKDDLYSRW